MSNLKRIIAHWTVGRYKANASDIKAYHFIVEEDGNIVNGKFKPEDNTGKLLSGTYAPHVRGLNTGSIGISMASMLGAIENKTHGDYPFTERQFEAMCKKIAELCLKYDIPITPQTVLSHAEVEPTLKKKQAGKWDFTVIPFKPELKGHKACGDYMRTRVSYYYNQTRTIPEPMEPKVTPIHIVQKGETLWGISRNYNLTVSEIMDANGLKSIVINPGDKLYVTKPAMRSNILGGAIAGIVLDRVAAPIVENIVDNVVGKGVDVLTDRVKQDVTKQAVHEIEKVIQHKTNNEPALQSRVTLGSLTAIIGAAVGIFQMYFDGMPNTWEDYAPHASVIGGALFALYGRWAAKKPLGA